MEAARFSKTGGTNHRHYTVQEPINPQIQDYIS